MASPYELLYEARRSFAFAAVYLGVNDTSFLNNLKISIFLIQVSRNYSRDPECHNSYLSGPKARGYVDATKFGMTPIPANPFNIAVYFNHLLSTRGTRGQSSTQCTGFDGGTDEPGN